MKVFCCLLLAVASQAAPAADPQVLLGGLLHAVVPAVQSLTYKTYTPTVETNVVALNNAVPVAVGGYKAVAGDNGALKGAVHEVPAIFGAPALHAQVNDASQGSLTVGTGAVVSYTAGEPIVNEHTVQVPAYGHAGVYYGKREADPQVLLGGLLPYAHHAVVPAVQSLTYKTITPTVETNVVALNNAVPVAVGGYKAVAGDNGALKGAVHEVPAIFGAPALHAQVNDASQGSLTVGTGAVVSYTAGEPIVKEHTVQVPTYGYGHAGVYYGKREAEASADPYYYGGYGGYYGHGLGYGYGLGYGHGYGYAGRYYG